MLSIVIICHWNTFTIDFFSYFLPWQPIFHWSVLRNLPSTFGLQRVFVEAKTIKNSFRMRNLKTQISHEIPVHVNASPKACTRKSMATKVWCMCLYGSMLLASFRLWLRSKLGFISMCLYPCVLATPLSSVCIHRLHSHWCQKSNITCAKIDMTFKLSGNVEKYWNPHLLKAVSKFYLLPKYR